MQKKRRLAVDAVICKADSARQFISVNVHNMKIYRMNPHSQKNSLHAYTHVRTYLVGNTFPSFTHPSLRLRSFSIPIKADLIGIKPWKREEGLKINMSCPTLTAFILSWKEGKL